MSCWSAFKYEHSQKHHGILLTEFIQEQNEKFLESRKVDPSIKDREAALQSLDAAYMEYLNIKRHLEEGIRASPPCPFSMTWSLIYPVVL